MNKQRGFTLIELLVVIAIIALLMAILIPALARVRKQAKSVICRKNLKEWGRIFRMYADTNNDLMPGKNTGWMNALRPYYRDSNDLRLCPMAFKPASPTPSVIGGQTLGGTYEAWGKFARLSGVGWATHGDYGSYGINEFVYSESWGLTHWQRFAVKDASQIPLFLDSIWPGAGPRPFPKNKPPVSPGQWHSSMSCFCIPRHGQCNINGIFLDYSVREVGLKELWTLKWHRQWDISEGGKKRTSPRKDDWPDWMKKCKDYVDYD